MGLWRSLVVAQGKGGVGKTSLTANVGGLAAHAGHRVLLVDLDPQGNLSRDLGYEPGDGEAFLGALVSGSPAPVARGIRERLDVVVGGPAMADLLGIAITRAGRGGRDLTDLLLASLTAPAENYDLIVIDTPPGDRLIVEAAMGVASHVLVPTRTDEASLDGLERVAERFAAARTRNPGLNLLGVCLFAVGARSQRMTAETRATVNEVLGEAAPVFDASIRHLESAAVDARRRGLLVHELEGEATADRKARLAALRRGGTHQGLLTRDATGLAGDYADLAREIVTRMAAHEIAIGTYWDSPYTAKHAKPTTTTEARPA